MKKTHFLTKKIFKNHGSLANWMNWLEFNFEKINYHNLDSMIILFMSTLLVMRN